MDDHGRAAADHRSTARLPTYVPAIGCCMAGGSYSLGRPAPPGFLRHPIRPALPMFRARPEGRAPHRAPRGVLQSLASRHRPGSMATVDTRCWPSVARSGSPSAGRTSDAASTDWPKLGGADLIRGARPHRGAVQGRERDPPPLARGARGDPTGPLTVRTYRVRTGPVTRFRRDRENARSRPFTACPQCSAGRSS